MARYSRICVGFDAFDRDPTFVDQLRALGLAHGAHLELVHVVPGPTHHVWFSSGGDPWDRLLCSQRRAQLEEVASALREAGVSVHCAVPAGEPHIELIRHAHQTRCDLLYVVDEPWERDEGRAFGATTRKLLRKCPVPVWAARLGSPGRPRRVVAALDVWPSSETAERPNARILDACLRLAGGADVDLTLLHVWNIWAEELLRGRMDGPEFERAVENAEREHRVRVEDWARRFDEVGLRPRVQLDKGDVRAVMPAAIERLAPDLVVMGTICRTGLPGLIIGNTAERILNRLPCSVLTVKPEGFSSPVPLEVVT